MRPWNRLHAVRVFRDTTSLSATPQLWPRLQQALRESEFLLLLASPEAAASEWVDREVAFWLDIAPDARDRLLIVWADGEVAWDAAAGDWDWARTTALPRALAGRLAAEPLYLDLRWARRDEDLSLRNPKFAGAVADLAPTLHGVDKDVAVGEDVRRHRQAMRLAWSAVVVLALLTVLAGAASYAALLSRREALAQRDVAVSRQLAVQAELTRGQQAGLLDRSVLLAVESLRLRPSLEAQRTLRAALALLARPVAVLRHGGEVTGLEISPDGEFFVTVSGGEALAWSMRAPWTADTLARWDSDVSGLAISRDSRYVALAGRDGRIVVREVGREAPHFQASHAAGVGEVALSPDGGTLAAAGDDGSVVLWDVRSGLRARVLRTGSEASALAFSPDGRRVATAALDRHVRVWDAASGRALHTLAHPQFVNSVVYSPDGRHLVTTGGAGTASVWEASRGRRVASLPHHGATWEAAFSPDGRLVALAGTEDEASVWEVHSGREVARLPHEAALNEVQFSADGLALLTGSSDNTARVWSVGEWRELSRMIHRESVYGAALAPSGRVVVTASLDRTARVWDVSPPETARMTHGEAVHAAEVDRSGTLLLAASGRDVTLSRLPDGAAVARARLEGDVRAVAFSADGGLFAAGGEDGTARVFDARTGREMLRLGHGSAVERIAFSPDGRRLMTLAFGSVVTVWDLPGGRRALRLRSESIPSAMAFLPGGDRVAVGYGQTARFGPGGFRRVGANELRVWSVASGEQVWRAGFPEPLDAVAVSPTGTYLAAGAGDGEVRVFETATLREVRRIPVEGALAVLRFDRSGNRLLGATGFEPPPSPADPSARLWDVRTGREIARMRHDEHLTDAVFSGDGGLVLTASVDRTARVWSASTGEELARFVHDDVVCCARFAQGRYVVTAGSDRTARVWPWRTAELVRAAGQRLTRNLTRAEWSQFLGGTEYRKTFEDLP